MTRARRGLPHRPRGARAGQHLPPQSRRRDARAHAARSSRRSKRRARAASTSRRASIRTPRRRPISRRSCRRGRWRGGYLKFVASLKDPATRARVAQSLRIGDGERHPRAQPADAPAELRAAVRAQAARRDRRADEHHAAEAALRLFEVSNVVADRDLFRPPRRGHAATRMKQPWVAVGSDSGAVVGAMRDVGAHPRAYGTFPRILGHYVARRASLHARGSGAEDDVARRVARRLQGSRRAARTG